jgi:4-hydroxythreonine-4-phosphate dehydrogenase
MGDPGGVGPEVIVKALRSRRLSPRCRYLVIGARSVFAVLQKKTGLKFPFLEGAGPSSLQKLKSGKVYFWDTGEGPFHIAKETAENGRLAIGAISLAAELANQGMVQAIVTGPLNKASARLERPDFVGHTEFFAKSSGTKRYAMMFVGPRLKLTLATIHIALKKVSGAVTRGSVLDKILLTDGALRRDFGIKAPKLAVCALNPHGRECGEEEDLVILPAVKQAQKKGVHVSGPFPADTVLHAAYHGDYDALISMYHDQALGAFKMVHFHDGVNVTIGLPYVRTSPDHGTAYDIAYQGKAEPSSMKAALSLAEKFVLNRHA